MRKKTLQLKNGKFAVQNYLFTHLVLKNCAYIHGKLHICKNGVCAISLQIINGIFTPQNCIFAYTNIYFKIITIFIDSPGYLPDLPTSPLPTIPPPPQNHRAEVRRCNNLPQSTVQPSTSQATPTQPPNSPVLPSYNYVMKSSTSTGYPTR